MEAPNITPLGDMIAISYKEDLDIAIALGFIQDYESNTFVRLVHPLVSRDVINLRLIIYKRVRLSDPIPDNMHLIQQILVNIGKHIIKTELQTLLKI